MFPTLLNAVLGYLDKPWKVVAVVVLLVFGLGAFLIYDQRVEITHFILHQRPHLLVEVYVKHALAILATTDADVTQLYRVDLENNVIVPVAGFARGGVVWIPNPLPRPLVYEHSDPRVVVSVISGTPLCADIPADGPILRVEYDLGIRRICLIGVPPFFGVTIGVMYLGWKTAPSEGTEYYARIALQTLSKQITSF